MNTLTETATHPDKTKIQQHKEETHDKVRFQVFIAGTGSVGLTLLKQIAELSNPEAELEVIGVCNSRSTEWNPDLRSIIDKGKPEGKRTGLSSLPRRLSEAAGRNLIFVDATGSPEVAALYPELFDRDIHVVTPSKIANSASQAFYRELRDRARKGNAAFRYETTAGAGLPVISTIRNLIASGDHVTEITGVLSGTMTYIFNRLQQRLPFSDIIYEAREKGYAEPDPRDDLSGEDVARKFLILARECGYEFDREEVKVQSLIPDELKECSPDEFLKQLPSVDGHWKNRNARALINNRKLCYTGRFTPSGIQIGVEEVRSDSLAGGLAGTDNLIRIYSFRYSESPLVIQGPGAGKEVTAAGVLADIFDITRTQSSAIN